MRSNVRWRKCFVVGLQAQKEKTGFLTACLRVRATKLRISIGRRLSCRRAQQQQKINHLSAVGTMAIGACVRPTVRLLMKWSV